MALGGRKCHIMILLAMIPAVFCDDDGNFVEHDKKETNKKQHLRYAYKKSYKR